MQLYTASALEQWELKTMQEQELAPLQLMERAAFACTEWLFHQFSNTTEFIVFCGAGNNGGDGLAITRMLLNVGIIAQALWIGNKNKISDSNKRNLNRLENEYPEAIQFGTQDLENKLGSKAVVIIDALLGIGTSRPAIGLLAEAIHKMNSFVNKKISIDLPSGLPADECFEEHAPVVNADFTLTFQQYKRSLLHPEGGRKAGEIVVLDIDLSADFYEQSKSDFYYTSQEEAALIYQPRKQYTHKGTYGTAMLMGGSYGMIGAISFAAKSASRAGAGKTIIHAPACGEVTLQTLCPEALFQPSGQQHIESFEGWSHATAIGIGPGMGTEASTAKALEELLHHCDKPMVLDADAINIIAGHKAWLDLLPENTILTPHPKEFERLFGTTNNSFQRLALAVKKSQEFKIIIVLKDRHTAVCLPSGDCHYNLSGNAALATGGTGDVLCGLITGLLSQGYPARDAALLAVYLHGKAGEIAGRKFGLEAVLAEDVATAIGEAYKSLFLQK